MIMAIEYVVAGLILTLTGAYLSPLGNRVAQIHALRKRCRKTHAIVLTYDDGPGDELTPTLLALLASENARASFFPTGRSAMRNPELLTQVAAAGHEVGSHSQNHIHAWRTTPWRNVNDIDAGYQTLSRWVPSSGLYRPPNGKATLATWWAVRRRRATFAWWTVDSGDTYPILPDPYSIVETVRREGGGVVLMHDFDRVRLTRDQRHAYVLNLTAQLLDMASKEGLIPCVLGQLLRTTPPTTT